MGTPIVFAAPYSAPPAPGPKWPGLEMTWTGWDGSVWTLTDETGGIYVPRGGLRGLTSPDVEFYKSEAAGVAGERILGSRDLPRDVFWPIEIFHDGGSQAWIDRFDAFMRTMDADRPGVWTVTQPGADGANEGSAPGRRRSLVCHFAGDGNHAFELDPSVTGYETFGLNLRAPSPYWRGDRIERGPWGEVAGEPFVPSTGGPPFFISSSKTAASAKIPNPGDVETYLTWVIRGTNGVNVGIDGVMTEVPFPVGDDQTLVIDTENQIALLDGVDVSGEMGEFEPVPVPARGTVALDVEILGAGLGSVSASLVPLYKRAI